MVLIHSPAPNKKAVSTFMPAKFVAKLEAINDFSVPRLELWDALQECRKHGSIKHIGVSNFTRRHIEEQVASKR